MITVEDVQKALEAEELDFSDEVVSQVLAAEHQHQRSVIAAPSPRPAEVDEALTRRVVHNLRKTGGEPVQRVGHQDAEVQRLEKAYRLRVDTTAPEDPAPKTTAKKAAKRPATTAAPTQKEQ